MEKVEVGMDSWGNKAAAADLSSGMFRGGGRPIDIYRRISSGINGTPMPAFEKLFQDNPDAIWHLVHFIRATANAVVQGKPPLSEADLPTAPVEPLRTTPTDQLSPPKRKSRPLPKQLRPVQRSQYEPLPMDTLAKESELAELKRRVSELESQIAAEAEYVPFQPTGYYTAYYATTGFMLGIFGAMAVCCSTSSARSLTGRHPLELIRVYLTFPLGDKAFDLPPEQNGLMLAIGCCLYLRHGHAAGHSGLSGAHPVGRRQVAGQ